MGFSIQDYLKKINSRLTRLDCASLFVTAVFLLILYIFIYYQQSASRPPVSYLSNQTNKDEMITAQALPFASRNGKTYTFSWCQGANRITNTNKVYFANEEEAKHSGRTLSKLCQK